MTRTKPALLRSLIAATAFFAAGSALSQQAPIVIELPPPLSIVADVNKSIYQINWYCNAEDPADCPPLEVRINQKDVKSPQDVAVGLVNDRNFAIVGSSLGRRAETLLFVEPANGGFWTRSRFSGAQADAIVVARKSKTVFIASNKDADGAVTASPLVCGANDAVTASCWGPATLVANVSIGGQACTDVVDLVEYPRRSGNLIATCASPAGVAAITFPSGSITEIVGPDDLLRPIDGMQIVPTGGDVAATDFGTFLLLTTNDQDPLTPNEAVLAFELDRLTGAWTRQAAPVAEYAGNLGGVAAGLCVDETNPVDGSPCAVISQSGDDGQARLVELVDNGGNIAAVPLLSAPNNLKNPVGGTSFANQGSVNLDDCAPNCQVATQVLNTSNATSGGGAPTGSVEFSTEGVFPDPRFVSPGICKTPAESLRLDFTGIPGLEDVYIDPQHCARDNGFFYIDVIDDAGSTLFDAGIVEWYSDDADNCYQTGDTVIPLVEDVSYGEWAGDPDDALLGEDDFAEDRLIGCFNPKRRGGETFSFIIEGFQGHQDFNVVSPDDLLYPYGDREINESLDIIDADSNCGIPPYTGACLEHVAALNKALVGWNLQDDLPNAATVVMKDAFVGGTPDETASAIVSGQFGTTLDLTATASAGNLTFKSVSDTSTTWTAMSVNGGEIEIGESLSFDITSAPRGIAVDVPFRVPSFTIAFLFDGPEFGDVEEKFQVTATLQDGTTLVGVLQAEYVSDTVTNPTWSRAGATTSLLSPADATGAAVIKVENPFGDEIVTDLVFEPINSSDCDNGGTCTNQSDGSVYDLEIEVVDRVEALEFAYEGLLESLCPVSTRPDYSSNPGTPGPRRPLLCETPPASDDPDVAAFNTVSPPRNIAGRQQVSAESLARFVGHNICLLVETYPSVYATADPDFCATAPPWDLFTDPGP